MTRTLFGTEINLLLSISSNLIMTIDSKPRDQLPVNSIEGDHLDRIFLSINFRNKC